MSKHKRTSTLQQGLKQIAFTAVKFTIVIAAGVFIYQKLNWLNMPSDTYSIFNIKLYLINFGRFNIDFFTLLNKTNTLHLLMLDCLKV